jgi:hypothetical protein
MKSQIPRTFPSSQLCAHSRAHLPTQIERETIWIPFHTQPTREIETQRPKKSPFVQVPPIHMIYALHSQCAGLGAVWPPKRERGAGLFLLTFFTFCYFFTVPNFYKLLFTVETGVKFVTFWYFFLLFVTYKGQGLYCIHCARGQRVRLDFFPFFFSVEGEGGGG